MAETGLNYFDNRNKVETTLLQTQYKIENLEPVGTTQQKKVTRIRTKTYSFIGLSRTTAKNCVKSKLEQYTRTYWNWIYSYGRWTLDKTTKNRYQDLVASIQATKQDGDLYNVEIQVNEETICYCLGEITNIDALFNYNFGTWDYDE